MRLVIAYDVSDNARRTVLSRRLARVGVRVQESVFECLVEDDELDDLEAHLTSLIEPASDVLNVYSQCDRCETRAVTLGSQRSDLLDALYWLV